MGFLTNITNMLRPRVKAPKGTVAAQAYYQHLQGDVFDGGGQHFAYEPTTSNPKYVETVFPQWNFMPLSPIQQGMLFSTLSVPSDPQQGFAFDGLQPTSLTNPDAVTATATEGISDGYYNKLYLAINK